MNMYNLVQGLGIIAYLVCFIAYGKKYKVSKLKSFLLGIASMIIYFVLVKFLAWVEMGFKGFGTENAIRVYVLIPAFMYWIAKFAKVDPIKIFDMEAPAGVLMYGVAHFACVFEGCCHGFAYFEGTPMYKIAHALTGTNMLPMQWFESICGILVFVVLAIIAHKKKYKTNGRLLCTWYIVFGTQRFFWEFLRDNQKVIKFAEMQQADGYIGISNLAIWSALMVLAGVILLFVFRYLEKNGKLKTSKQTASA